mgnify:CR=1 FL=1
MSKAQLLVVIQFILFAVIGASVLLFSTAKSPTQWMVGGVVTIAGLVIGLWAISEHGRVNRGGPKAVPTPNPEAELITSGLYQRIRHPIYTGVLMVAFGMTIWHGHVVTLTASVLLVGLLTYKSMYEEELLRAQYPQYPTYMKSTGRFLPKLF